MWKRFVNSRIHTIILHCSIWGFFILIPSLVFGVSGRKLIDIAGHFSLIILFFYLNYLFYIPRLLLKRKYLLYVVAILGSLVFTFGISTYWHTRAAHKEMTLSGLVEEEQVNKLLDQYPEIHDILSTNELMNIVENFRPTRRVPIPVRSVFSVLFILAISTSIRFIQEWRKNEKQKREIVNNMLNAEISLLKSQVNPHFLFNTLNSIYSLANKRSEKTADAIVRLSNLIRYMLYDTDKEMVSLDQEIEYIGNYIQLQKLRLYNNVDIQLNIEGDTEGIAIAPMILIPFIENAFKHGIDTSNSSFITITLKVTDIDMEFRVENSISSVTESGKEKTQGIGIKNVKRRLNLLYPGKHILNIKKQVDTYLIKLIININQNELHNS